MELEVIVVAHESAAALASCLSGLPASYRSRFIVVDNASSDGSADVAAALGARTLVQRRNLGFGRAANLGARQATASHLCFLNPDCRPGPELFDAALERLREAPDLCLAVELHEADGFVLSGRQPGYSVAKLLHDALATNYRPGRLAGLLRRVPGFHDERWFWPHGACFFFERRRFLELGGFDPRYFLYMEDVDFGRRLYQAGGRVDALDQPLAHRARSGALVPTAYRLWHLNAARVRYAAGQHGAPAAAAVALLAAPGFLAHAARGALSASARRLRGHSQGGAG